ncbi:NAD/NADP octopine/nopaline dehydrogenase family protein [Caballeronia zhejiangensis]|uniref:NAD/NADP octopine/nopaline dehydrogenase family protein n=1 Tax=Caballeronia zhejiangensis TaxID=871203 RepID=UPI0007C789D5|nr:NAD/NADP octopine/nopaline dehydrogenase family protein [Caballeronia zhejiangensis]
MRVLILGAGSLGLGYASYLASLGHGISIWSRSGEGATDLTSSTSVIHSSGKVYGSYEVEECTSLAEGMKNADLVVFAIPGYGHESVIRAIADHARDDQMIVITPIVSLSALILARLVAETSARPLICASPTTFVTARKKDRRSVDVLTLRPQLAVSSFPANRINEAIARLTVIFGSIFTPQSTILTSTLANTGPVVHVPLALMNMSRIEHGEAWLHYEQMTENVSKMIMSVDEERLRLADAFGYLLNDIEDHFCTSFGAQKTGLANAAAEIAKLRNGGPAGPTTTATRFLTEDVPFGLGFFAYLGTLVNLSMPATNACITMAEMIFGADKIRKNGLLSSLNRQDLTCDQLISLCEGNCYVGG